MAGVSWQQEPEAAAHVLSIIRRLRRLFCFSALLLLYVQGKLLPIIKMGRPTSINGNKMIPTVIPRDITQVTVYSVKLTIHSNDHTTPIEEVATIVIHWGFVCFSDTQWIKDPKWLLVIYTPHDINVESSHNYNYKTKQKRAMNTVYKPLAVTAESWTMLAEKNALKKIHGTFIIFLS